MTIVSRPRMIPVAPSTARVSIHTRLRIARYSWMLAVAVSILVTYVSGGSTSVSDGRETWPRWAWITMAAVCSLASFLALAAPAIVRLQHPAIEGVALGTFGAMALARIFFLLSTEAPASTIVTPVVLWSGCLLTLFKATALRREGIG